jgi:hypothetical protein
MSLASFRANALIYIITRRMELYRLRTIGAPLSENQISSFREEHRQMIESRMELLDRFRWSALAELQRDWPSIHNAEQRIEDLRNALRAMLTWMPGRVMTQNFSPEIVASTDESEASALEARAFNALHRLPNISAQGTCLVRLPPTGITLNFKLASPMGRFFTTTPPACPAVLVCPEATLQDCKAPWPTGTSLASSASPHPQQEAPAARGWCRQQAQ